MGYDVTSNLHGAVTITTAAATTVQLLVAAQHLVRHTASSISAAARAERDSVAN